MGSFETRLRFTQAPQGPTTQAVYWFISLLFAFFVLFALVHTLMRLWRRGAARPAAPKAASSSSALRALLLFGALTSALYFVSLLLIPDTSWFTLSAFLEFQVTRLAPYAGCFALGVYAQSRGWFGEGKPLGSLTVWGPISAALAAAYLVLGQPIFNDPAGAMRLPVGLLLAFALIRSFLLLSLLVLLVSVGARYWNRSNSFDQQLGQTSYNIYLTHYWAVILTQGALLDWTGGPVLAKIAIVLVVALAMSFAISRWVIGRWPRAFALALLALFVFCLAVRP
jgi:glucan biosynthesis protein C